MWLTNSKRVNQRVKWFLGEFEAQLFLENNFFVLLFQLFLDHSIPLACINTQHHCHRDPIARAGSAAFRFSFLSNSVCVPMHSNSSWFRFGKTHLWICFFSFFFPLFFFFLSPSSFFRSPSKKKRVYHYYYDYYSKVHYSCIPGSDYSSQQREDAPTLTPVS